MNKKFPYAGISAFKIIYIEDDFHIRLYGDHYVILCNRCSFHTRLKINKELMCVNCKRTTSSGIHDKAMFLMKLNNFKP